MHPTLPPTLAAAVLLGFTSLAAQQPPPKFDDYVRRVMMAFTVPGLSVAIVKDGRVVLAKGYGVRIAFSEGGSIGAIANMAGYLTFVR